MMKTKNAKEFVKQIKGDLALSMTDEHELEQIAFRLDACKDDCAKTGRCVKCNCPFGKMVFSEKGCNEGRYPPYMDAEEWIQYKESNGIIFEE